VMNVQEKILCLERTIGCSLQKDYRTILESNPAGLRLRKTIRLGSQDLELRFLLGFNGTHTDLLECMHNLMQWTKGEILPIIEDMSQEYICIVLKGIDAGKIVQTSGHTGHPDDDVLFEPVSPSFSEFWSALREIQNPPIDEFQQLVEQGTTRDCEQAFGRCRDINEKDARGHSLVEVAAVRNNVQVVRWCLERGASAGNSLVDAFFNASWDVIEYMLKMGYGFDPEQKDMLRGVPISNSQWSVSGNERLKLRELMRQAEINYKKK
jgi:hypothetical protein